MKKLFVFMFVIYFLASARADVFSYIEDFGTGTDATLDTLGWNVVSGSGSATSAAATANGWSGRALDGQSASTGVQNKYNIAIPGLVADPTAGLWEFTADVRSYPTTGNSAVALSVGDSSRAAWVAQSDDSWFFDVRGITGGSSDYEYTPVDSDLHDQPIIAKIWVDFDNGTTWGSVSNGVTTYTTSMYTIDPARSFNSFRVMQDRRGTPSRDGMDVDNLSIERVVEDIPTLQINQQWNRDWGDYVAWGSGSVTSCDLIDPMRDTFSSAQHNNFNSSNGTTPMALTDGIQRNGATSNYTQDNIDGQWESIYYLNTSIEPVGYTITEVRTLASGWGTNINQDFEVSVQKVGSSNWVYVGRFIYMPDNVPNTWRSTQIRILGLGYNEPIAENVSAIKFSVNNPNLSGSGATHYAEWDVFGRRQYDGGDGLNLNKANQFFLDEGLQLIAWTWNDSDPLVYRPRNRNNLDGLSFTALEIATPFDWPAGQRDILGPAPGTILWGRQGWDIPASPSSDDLPFMDTYKFVSYWDEPDLTDTGLIDQIKTWYDSARGNYPDVLLYTNSSPSQSHAQYFRYFQKQVEPDMLCTDVYPCRYANGNLSEIEATHNMKMVFLRMVELHRKLGLEGLDGTGLDPLAFGMYMQFFYDTTSYRHPSESELRFEYFASLTSGAKFLKTFFYSGHHTDFEPILYQDIFGGPDRVKSVYYDKVLTLNKQTLRLGQTLNRLINIDTRFLPGMYDDGVYAETLVPIHMRRWSACADTFMTNITVTNPGSENGGNPGDVLIGYFKPLLADDRTGEVMDDMYFMITNCLTETDLTADLSETTQNIRLDFDFAGTTTTELQKFNRNTGLVETVPLVHDGDSNYHLDMSIEGGSGELYKFKTDVDFLISPLTCRKKILIDGKYNGDINGDCKVDLLDLELIVQNWLNSGY